LLKAHHENPVVVGQRKTIWFTKVRNASPKISKHSVLTQKETDSNWCNIALAAIDGYNRPCKYTLTHWCLLYIFLSNKTSLPHNCLYNGVT